MNKIKNPYLILILLFIVLTVIWLIFFSMQSPIIGGNKSITGVVSKAYPDYEIKNVELFYVDFYSTIRPADDEHKPTEATVTIQKDDEVRTIYLKKEFRSWKIISDSPDSGPNMPNGDYYAEINIINVGQAVNMEEHIKEEKYWVIPRDGKDYEVFGDDNDFYYSVIVCENIYKIMNNSVYEFDKKESKWVKSTRKLSEIQYYANYEKITKKEAQELLKKYASYKEK